MPQALVTAATLCLLVYCVINVITTPAGEVRNLPKLVWLPLVLLFPVLGGIAWLLAGRPPARPRSTPYQGSTAVPPRPTSGSVRLPRSAPPRPPDDDEAFLRSLRERAEEQRRRAAEQRREASEQERPDPA